MKASAGESNLRRAAQVGRVLLGAMILMMSSAVQAQTAAQSSHAFEAYGRGQRLFGEHNYAEAQAAFEEAYAAVPNPVVLLGIAESQQRRSMWPEALATLERYLLERPDAPDRERIQQDVEAIRGALAPVVEPGSTASRPRDTTTSPITVAYVNMMSSTFKLVRAVYSIDGTPVVTRSDERNGLDPHERFDLKGATMAPGVHMLTVDLEFRGQSYGVFSYLEAYQYKVRSSHAFSTALGNAIHLTVIAFERGGPTTPREQRPSIRYVERVLPAAGQVVSNANMPLAQSDVR